MMAEISSEEIRNELAAIRAEISRVPAGFSAIAALMKDHSKWSAHGDWSSGSEALAGRFSLSSELGQPRTVERATERLDKVLSDVSSERFMEVAKSLRSVLMEK